MPLPRRPPPPPPQDDVPPPVVPGRTPNNVPRSATAAPPLPARVTDEHDNGPDVVDLSVYLLPCENQDTYEDMSRPDEPTPQCYGARPEDTPRRGTFGRGDLVSPAHVRSWNSFGATDSHTRKSGAQALKPNVPKLAGQSFSYGQKKTERSSNSIVERLTRALETRQRNKSREEERPLEEMDAGECEEAYLIPQAPVAPKLPPSRPHATAPTSHRSVQQHSDEDCSDGWSDSEFDDENSTDWPKQDDSQSDGEYQVAEGGDVSEELYEEPEKIANTLNDQKKTSFGAAQKPTKAPKSSSPPRNISAGIMNRMKGLVVGGSPSSFEAKKPPTNQRGKHAAGNNNSVPTKKELPALPVKPATAEKPAIAARPGLLPKPGNRDQPPIPSKSDFKSPDNSFDDNTSGGSTSSASGGQLSVRPLPNIPGTITSPTTAPTKVLVLPPVPQWHSDHGKTEGAGKKKPLPPTPDSAPQPVQEEESQEIYSDAASERALTDYDWYHGDISRDEGQKRLKSHAKNGGFLVRTSSKSAHPYTLVVYLEKIVYNMIIRCRTNDKKFAIGKEKPDEVAFASLQELIEYHQSHYVSLVEGGSVRLTGSPPKS
ncbi:B-cell linker protein [Aplysia californica]|uniref:B-cell linker protein n=1 Tax=Aplysia californica TaxID=6500 RepID=A0ABM1VZP7_APLCA|nr:B-cell linker protein [Aplysia californica]